jgi:hypothetical protein
MARKIMQDEDIVTRLIGYCHQDKAGAKQLFDALIAHEGRDIELPAGHVHLSKMEHDEFVARFSAEVEPTLWRSAMRKD